MQKKGAQGWWDWHPSKTALEYLWRCGDLAITRRDGFQKVYDLAERVIPATARDGTALQRRGGGLGLSQCTHAVGLCDPERDCRVLGGSQRRRGPGMVYAESRQWHWAGHGRVRRRHAIAADVCS